MIKFLGIIFLLLSGSAYGAFESGKLKRNCIICSEIRELFTQIHIKIRYSGIDVYEIVHELKKSGLYYNIDFIRNLPDEFTPDCNFHNIWKKAIINDMSLGDDEKMLLSSYGEVLGTTDIAGQLMSTEEALDKLSKIEEKRNEEYKRKGKLYRSLGMLSGVMIGILLI